MDSPVRSCLGVRAWERG